MNESKFGMKDITIELPTHEESDATADALKN